MNILVADDEMEVAELLKEYVVKACERICPQEQNTVHVYEKGFGVIDYIENTTEQIDIVFLDIVFGKENGIHLAEEIQKRNNRIKIIFVSGYAEYVEEIFDVKPFCMLLKPTTVEKIEAVIEKAVKALTEEQENFITVKNKEGIYTINLNDIYYIKSERRYVKIVLKDMPELKVIMTMSEAEEKMGSILLQCHRSYFVNVRRIKLLKKASAVMMNDEEIPIANKWYQMINTRFLENLLD